MAVAGMPANPDEARQVGRHIADRRAARYARGSDVGGACRGFDGERHQPRHAPAHTNPICVESTLASRTVVETNHPTPVNSDRSKKEECVGARNISNQIVSIQP